MAKPLALLIDDSDEIREMLKAGLERDSFVVVEATEASQVNKLLRTSKPDVILLDLMLPDDNGLNLISKIRKYTDAPILVVSGKVNVIDRVIGFEAGADDYISKPFHLQEVLARVKAHTRRYRRSGTAKTESIKDPKISRIRFGDWIMDRQRLQVYTAAGEQANLTLKEFKLLEVLVMSPHQVFSREQLLEDSRGFGVSVTDRAVDTQIVRIRRKINDMVSEQPMIYAVRGIGYIFSCDTDVMTE